MNKALKLPKNPQFNSEMHGFKAATKEDIQNVLDAFPGICWVECGARYFLPEEHVVKSPYSGMVYYVPPKYNWNSGRILDDAYCCWIEMQGSIYE